MTGAGAEIRAELERIARAAESGGEEVDGLVKLGGLLAAELRRLQLLLEDRSG